MYVYVLRSKKETAQTYIGCTNNIRERLGRHNRGEVPYTSKFLPWEFVTVIWIKEERKAWILEGYLKSGAGRAFLKKHF